MHDHLIIPVIIGATGIVTGLKKNMEDMPGKHLMDTLEKTNYLPDTNLMHKISLFT